MSSPLERTDPEVFAAIQREMGRLEANLELDQTSWSGQLDQ